VPSPKLGNEVLAPVEAALDVVMASPPQASSSWFR
jgi:hypothetical protein